MRTAGLRRLSVAAVAVAAVAALFAVFQPLAGDGDGRVRVTIPQRAGVGEIGDILDQEQVVPSSALFGLRAKLAGDSGDLKPGVYYLRRHMSYEDVLDHLVGGPAKDVVQLTIPEGLSRAEIAPLAGRAGVRGDYLTASAKTGLIDARAYGVQGRLRNLEGFLFPATYELRRGASADSLVSKQLTAFRQRFAGVGLSYARRKNLTAFDVLTIASMIERETSVARDRPLVAAVIYNRLHARQPLGIDATVRYATGNWSSPLTKSQLATASPYNTRRNPGLSPGPIGNPGLASIEAAARPAHVGYLYYVVKPGTCGQHAFSTTFAQFEQDQQRYQQARAKAGGKSPTSCPNP